MSDKKTYYNDAMPNTTEERTKEAQKAIVAWWCKVAVCIIILSLMSGMDGLSLYDIMDKAMTQSWYMGIVLSVGISVVINLIPTILGIFVHRAIYKTHKYSKTLAAIGVVAFIVMMGATINLRYSYADYYGDVEEAGLTNTITIDTEDVTIKDSGKSRRSNAIVLLLSLENLATSICCFILGYVSYDELKKLVEVLERQEAQLEYEIAIIKTENEIEHDVTSRIEMELEFDSEMLAREIESVRAKELLAMAISRERLAMYLQNPEAISKLSFQLDFEDESGETGMYEYPVSSGGLHVVPDC